MNRKKYTIHKNKKIKHKPKTVDMMVKSQQLLVSCRLISATLAYSIFLFWSKPNKPRTEKQM